MKKILVIEVISFLFILLFIYAAASKLLDIEKFRVQIGQSPLLTTMAGWVAWFIPTIEILISIMLIIPKLRLIGLYSAFGLMVMFTAYIVVITRFSQFIPCSCGGILQSMGWTEHLFFNACFVFLGLAGIVLHNKHLEDLSLKKLRESGLLSA